MILITSSTGPVGSNLVIRFTGRPGQRVRVLVRNLEWAAHFAGEVEAVRRGTWISPKTPRRDLRGVRVVYLISHSSQVQPLIE